MLYNFSTLTPVILSKFNLLNEANQQNTFVKKYSAQMHIHVHGCLSMNSAVGGWCTIIQQVSYQLCIAHEYMYVCEIDIAVTTY